jgi:hypothetical protein
MSVVDGRRRSACSTDLSDMQPDYTGSALVAVRSEEAGVRITRARSHLALDHQPVCRRSHVSRN